MKFAMNGALTIGTLDGANVEIRDAVGPENFFLFGLTAEQVRQAKADGYRPGNYYESNPELREAIDLIDGGFFTNGDRTVFRPLVESLLTRDEYHAPGRLSGVCGLPATRQRCVPRSDELDTHDDPQ